MRRTCLIFACLLLWCAIAGCGEKKKEEVWTVATIREKLVGLTKASFEFSDLEERVGRAPAINTASPKDRDAILHGNYDLSDSSIDLTKAAEVAYWITEEKDGTAIVGILRSKDGSLLVFDGRILPP